MKSLNVRLAIRKFRFMFRRFGSSDGVIRWCGGDFCPDGELRRIRSTDRRMAASEDVRRTATRAIAPRVNCTSAPSSERNTTGKRRLRDAMRRLVIVESLDPNWPTSPNGAANICKPWPSPWSRSRCTPSARSGVDPMLPLLDRFESSMDVLAVCIERPAGAMGIGRHHGGARSQCTWMLHRPVAAM